jgi:hypothetical protein
MHHLLEFGFFLDSINLGFLLRENFLLCSSYLPLGVPNWTVKNHQHRATSINWFPDPSEAPGLLTKLRI